MPRPEISLILLDIDGCLLPGRADELDYRSFTDIREYCTGLGPGEARVVLCTGRPQPYTAAIITVLGAIWPGTPSVVESGAYLYYPAENRAHPNRVLTPALLAQWKKFKKDTRARAPSMSARFGLGEKLGLSLIPMGQDVDSLYSLVREQFADIDHIEITHSSMCVDIAPRGVNKRTGILQLAAETGIDPARMLAVGDSINDLKMLDTVGIPTCPANAHPQVKEKCVYISPFPHTAGVWDIIRRYILLKNNPSPFSPYNAPYHRIT